MNQNFTGHHLVFSTKQSWLRSFWSFLQRGRDGAWEEKLFLTVCIRQPASFVQTLNVFTQSF